MAKKIGELKRREIRCIIYTDRNGVVNKITNIDVINNIMKNEDKEKYTIIYNPTSEQRNEIVSKSRSEKSGESNEEIVKITGDNFISEMLVGLTDIDIDLNNEEEIKQLESLIRDEGNEEFELIYGELCIMYTNMWKVYVSQANAMFEMGESIDIIKKTTETMKTKSNIPQTKVKKTVNKTAKSKKVVK